MNGKRTPMSTKEIRRAQLLERVAQGERSLCSIASVMQVSYRQAKRLYRRYRQEGAQGLVHRNVGKRSHRRIDPEVRQAIIAKYHEQYRDFGPTLAAEKLRERDGLQVDHETLRRWLIAEGLRSPRRRRPQYRSRRERRRRFGELVQFDGSPHAWFEDRGERCCLMNMVDDATGTTLAFLCEQETTDAAFRLLWRWIERYGIPQAVYCDRKNAYVLDRELTVQEQLAGIKPKSHIQRACDQLGIEVIIARSAQGKGRVERSHGVYQDRLVKELRLAGINEIESANALLTESYLDTVNKRFSKLPIDPIDAHVPLLPTQSLADILCRKEPRVVSRDYVVRFHNRMFQVMRSHPSSVVRPGTRVEVHTWLDGSLHVVTTGGKKLRVQEIKHEQRTSKENALSA